MVDVDTALIIFNNVSDYSMFNECLLRNWFPWVVFMKSKQTRG